MKLKQLLLTSLILAIISLHPSTIMAQTVAVTGTITDTQTTPYSNGLLTVTFVNSTSQQATFGGNPSFQKSYSVFLDANGSFTVSLPPNSTASPSIQPAGTQWNFSYQSQGGYGAANINVTITGAGSISGTLSNLARITWPYGNIPPPGAAGQGIVFVSSTRLGWGTTGGAGSVTHTAGNLTLNSMMLGNGIADAKVDSACVTDGAGALSGCVSINTPGTVTGNIGSYNSIGTNLMDVACAAQSVSSASQDRFYCDGTNWPVVSMNTNAAQKLALSMGAADHVVNYTADQSDCGKLVTMNGVSLTFTLPAAIIKSACVIDVKNRAATSLTIARNGLNVDGAAANPTALTQNQSYRITNDGAGYWTEALLPAASALTAHGVSTPLTCAAASASGTAYTCTTSPTFTPADGDIILFQADVASTGAMTLNVNSTSAAPVKKQGGGTAIVANDFLAGQDTLLQFDGVNWQMQGQTGNAPGTGTVTTTGSPASTNCAYFSGATSIIGTANCTLDASGNITLGGNISKVSGSGPNIVPLSGQFASVLNNMLGGAGFEIRGGAFQLADSSSDTSSFVIANATNGVITKYAGVATTGNGVPAENATAIDLTAQTAAITPTTVYTAPATGFYRVCFSADITTAGTTSVLGGAAGFAVVYTSPTDSVVKTTTLDPGTTSSGNTTGTAVDGCKTVYAKTGTNIQYSFGYSSTGTVMQFEIHVREESL